MLIGFYFWQQTSIWTRHLRLKLSTWISKLQSHIPKTPFLYVFSPKGQARPTVELATYSSIHESGYSIINSALTICLGHYRNLWAQSTFALEAEIRNRISPIIRNISQLTKLCLIFLIRGLWRRIVEVAANCQNFILIILIIHFCCFMIELSVLLFDLAIAFIGLIAFAPFCYSLG